MSSTGVEVSPMQCPICLTNSMKTSVKLSCNHYFCIICIYTWYIKNQTCPVCRKIIWKKTLEDFPDSTGLLQWKAAIVKMDVNAASEDINTAFKHYFEYLSTHTTYVSDNDDVLSGTYEIGLGIILA